MTAKNKMKNFFFITLIGLFTGNVKGQISFSQVESKIKKLKDKNE